MSSAICIDLDQSRMLSSGNGLNVKYRVNSLPNDKNLTLYHTSRFLTTLRKKPLEKIVGKGENAGNQNVLLFAQWFLPFPKEISSLESYLMTILNSMKLGESSSNG